MAHNSQHRQDARNQHVGIPTASLTDFEVGGMPILFLEGHIAQDHHLDGHAIN
ncbi:MAG: hypothetical protein K8L97_00825 [Anaerolineae bacterium]|nr:hypothetical protein [Anaerolineae bacterium]